MTRELLELRHEGCDQEPAPTGRRNSFREQLERHQFAFVLEVVPSGPNCRRARQDILSLIDEVASMEKITTFAIGDRIGSDEDPDPVEFAEAIVDRFKNQPIVHVAGKDRRLEDVVATIARMRRAGLENALLMTGDRVKNRMRERTGTVRYIDSVNMIDLFTRTAPELFTGAVVNPFKRVHEDYANQILKLEKKLRAGAQFIVAQIGFSWRAYRRLLEDCLRISPHTPLLAAAVYLPLRVAQRLHEGYVPGVTLPRELFHRIQAEHRDKGARRYYVRRLAIQILGLRALGYAGVQVSAIHTPETVKALLEELDNLGTMHASCEDLLRLWDEYLPTGKSTTLPVNRGSSDRSLTWSELTRYRLLESVDHLLFAERSPLAPIATRIIRWLSASSVGDRLLRGVEQAVKGPLVGCKMCGLCRLPYTMYVCPETCPKGLANGPCGGTQEGVCEFGDRLCVHNRKYRLAVMTGRVRELAEIIIPPVPEDLRGRSSWVTHFKVSDPSVRATGATGGMGDGEGEHGR